MTGSNEGVKRELGLAGKPVVSEVPVIIPRSRAGGRSSVSFCSFVMCSTADQQHVSGEDCRDCLLLREVLFIRICFQGS